VSKHPPAEQWKVLEQIKADGLARSVGVSNFREEDLLAMQGSWSVVPAVNQVSGRCGKRKNKTKEKEKKKEKEERKKKEKTKK
jgi:diketogulonate reductase-like aldo/keto reductase